MSNSTFLAPQTTSTTSPPLALTITDPTQLAPNIDLPRSFTANNSSLFNSVMSYSLSIKLDQNKFLLWKSVIPTVNGYDLEGHYLDATHPKKDNLYN